MNRNRASHEKSRSSQHVRRLVSNRREDPYGHYSPFKRQHDNWMSGERRFPGALRLPGVACVIRVQSCIQRNGTPHPETRCYVSSAVLDAQKTHHAVRGHWTIENSLHWVLDIGFGDDQCHLRKGFWAKNMAVARHFAVNLVRPAKDNKSIKLRRKVAGWTSDYLDTCSVSNLANWIRSPGPQGGPVSPTGSALQPRVWGPRRSGRACRPPAAW